MSDSRLESLRRLMQEDVGNRGLRTDPDVNLITATAGDFESACRSVAGAEQPALAVVTGFFIPHARPPAGETDGPLGALFLARALAPLGVRVVLVSDAFCTPALQVGLSLCGLAEVVPLVTLPSVEESVGLGPEGYRRRFFEQAGRLTHLVAVERVGPSHTAESLRLQPGATPAMLEQYLREVPVEHQDRCHSMKGRDITATMSPAHWLFEATHDPEHKPEAQARGSNESTPRLTTIGIGDGGNELGMGKIAWDVIRRNIPGGAVVACRVPADHLIVCGISNWGAYALAAGIRLLRGASPSLGLFDPDRERELLRAMVEQGPLVDGVTGQPAVAVDGLSFERYVEPLRRMGEIG
jgi:hypothetical protein